MGVDPLTMFAVSTALQIGGGLFSYSQQKKADRDAKAAADAEAGIMMQDAERQAREERLGAKEAKARQKMLYLASGVDLEGSPLLEMQRTARRGDANAETVLGNAASRADLIRRQGGIQRASLVGTALDVGKSVMGNYNSYQMLKKQLTTTNPAAIGSMGNYPLYSTTAGGYGPQR